MHLDSGSNKRHNGASHLIRVEAGLMLTRGLAFIEEEDKTRIK